MDRKITVQRMVKKDVTVGLERTCDVCGKLILKKNEDKITCCIGKHWGLTIGHYDWGNDSCDSVEQYDICSAECLEKELQKYVQRGGTAFFDVECKDYNRKEGK